MSVEIIQNVISSEDAQTIVSDLVKLYPDLARENLHCTVDDSFQYLDYIPNLYVPNLKHQIGRYAVSMNKHGWYPGIEWHSDGTEDELSMLLYISGDNSHGGDFLTKESVNKFELYSLFILNSSIVHCVTPYSCNVPRIAFKWRYKI